MATVASHKRLFTYYQKDGIDNHTYHCEFLAHVQTIKTYGGVGGVGVTPKFITAKLKEMAATNLPLILDAKNPTNTECATAIKTVCDEYLVALMLSGYNKDCYSSLCVDLRNDFAFGDDRYPKMINQCLSLINCWGSALPVTPKHPRPTPNQPPADANKQDEALVFAQGESKPSPKPSQKGGVSDQH